MSTFARDTFVRSDSGALYVLYETTQWSDPEAVRMWYPVGRADGLYQLASGDVVHSQRCGIYTAKGATLVLAQRGQTVAESFVKVKLEAPKCPRAEVTYREGEWWKRTKTKGEQRLGLGLEPRDAWPLDPVASKAEPVGDRRSL